jgi:hypothetical protein
MRLRELAAILLLTTAGASGPTPATGAVARTDGEAGSRQKLTVWRVLPVGPPRPVSIASLSPVVRGQTAGSFGQTSGGFGNSAGSTGQTAGSLGQTAGSVGQTAGSTGQTAGGFGESLDTISTAAEASNGTLVSAPIGAAAAASVTGTTVSGTRLSGATAARTREDRAWERLSSEVTSLYEVTFEDVGATELRERLKAVAGKNEAPDVLVTLSRPKGWLWRETGLTHRDALRTVGRVEPVPLFETLDIPTDRNSDAEVSVMVHAPHPLAARAFVLWLLEEGRIPPREVAMQERLQAPVAVAKSALASVLSGGGVGDDADREIAGFDPATAQRAALLPDSGDPLGALKIDIDTTSANANERFAVVALRAVLEGPDNFGAAHALVVMRMDSAGQWKVLQLTPNLTVEEQSEAVRRLRDFGTTVRPEAVENLTRVALAAPVDGDNRPPVPELWWENPGGGTLQIVEWQRNEGRSWTSSNMYFVPGDNGHLRTRTTGRFADRPGTYRWRVWSLGRGGTVAISLWRSVNIVTQQAQANESDR